MALGFKKESRSPLRIAPSQDKLHAPLLRIDHLSKAYEEGVGSRVVLDKASTSISAGAFVAIVGKSGSGKSTLLNLIAGIDDADAGSVWFRDIHFTSLDERARTLFRRRQIGFIFQFFNLIPTLTVWENIMLPLELNKMKSQADIRRAESLLRKVDLIDRRDSYPDVLSGGEQQRVALARALVHQPTLILADEPTGNLDEETGSVILSLFRKLVQQNNHTVIMVTHSEEAASEADRILEIHGGKLIEQR